MSAPARLTVLGSGTLLPDDVHRSAAHLLEAGGRRLLMDCGAGTLHGFERHGVDWRRLDAVVLSHFHTDHVGDLPALLFALKHGIRPLRTDPLEVVGPPGLAAVLDGLEAALGAYVRDPGFPLDEVELARDASREMAPGLRLRFHPTPHTHASVAHRWDGEGWSVGYTGDTGPEPALSAFFAGVDVLVCECGLPEDSALDVHLSPRDVARLGRRAEPALLITTHVYPPLSPGEVPGAVRRAGYRGRVVAGVDGLAVEVGEGEPRISRSPRA